MREKLKISVICPFYNEESILKKAVAQMLCNLDAIKYRWELILVDDGSDDSSCEIVEEFLRADPRVKVVSFPVNRGRGYALVQGIKAADGDIIITTEIDLSWGDDIIHRLVEKLVSEPSRDVVVASPNLPGGGYKNVPLRRVLVSRIGNILLQLLFTKNITMNTGMTRAYRNHVIKNLPTMQTGKEFHLEVLLKLISLGYNTAEIPALLEWKDDKLTMGGPKKRKSSSRMGKLILSHLDFAIFANPIRYFWAISVLLAFAGIFSLLGFFPETLDSGAFLIGLLLLISSGILFGFGILSNQNNYILRELWRVQRFMSCNEADPHKPKEMNGDDEQKTDS